MLAKVNLFGQKLSLESAALGIIMLVATLSIPIWNLVARKFNKRSAYISGMMFWIVVQILLILLKPGQMNLVLLFSFFAGFSVSTAHVMPESMFPDVIDWDELRTRTRHEGMYYGAINFMRKLSSALAIFITLQVLGWFGYQTPPKDAPSFSVNLLPLQGIRLLTGHLSFSCWQQLPRPGSICSRANASLASSLPFNTECSVKNAPVPKRTMIKARYFMPTNSTIISAS